MEDLNEEIYSWYEKLEALPSEVHLLCPRIHDEDGENYKVLNDPDSAISIDEKKARIHQAQDRIEITYWNSLSFGFDKQTAGQWGLRFSQRLEHCLKNCAECVLNWHMKRKAHLQNFSE